MSVNPIHPERPGGNIQAMVSGSGLSGVGTRIATPAEPHWNRSPRPRHVSKSSRRSVLYSSSATASRNVPSSMYEGDDVPDRADRLGFTTVRDSKAATL